MAPKPVDPDKLLAERLLSWHKPTSDGVANSLDSVRSRYLALANFVLKTAPPSPDRTRAIELLGDACRQAVFAVVANQPEPAPEPTPTPAVKKVTRARKATK